jgi:hypothetical protein
MSDQFNCSWCNQHSIPGMYSQSDISGRFCSPACRTAATEDHLRVEIGRLKEWAEISKDHIIAGLRHKGMDQLADRMKESKSPMFQQISMVINVLWLEIEEAKREIKIVEAQRDAYQSDCNYRPLGHTPEEISDQIIKED